MLPVHPGCVLKRELTARERSANGLALSLRLPFSRIVETLNGNRGISAETALRLGGFSETAHAFG
jgi:plasmid maintenance system antidote protein VapI